MRSDKQNRNDVVDLFSLCPLCQKRHSNSDARMLGSEGDTCVWHIKCGNCLNSFLALVMKNKNLISSVGMITDLSREDVPRIIKQSVVSADDVLRIYQTIKSPEHLKQLLSA